MNSRIVKILANPSNRFFVVLNGELISRWSFRRDAVSAVVNMASSVRHLARIYGRGLVEAHLKLS